MSKITYAKDTITFDNAISNYYKLKGKYNNNINKQIKEIFEENKDKDKNFSQEYKDQKKMKYSEIKKKCIICGKSGGTIFTEDNTTLYAKCGNIDAPCKLNIQLQRAKYDTIINAIATQNNTINFYKNNIINTKLKFLFGFDNKETTIAEFEKIKTDLIKTIKEYQNNTSKYFNTIYNLENVSKINTLNDTLFDNINIFKEHITNYKETGKNSYLRDAIEVYINTIVIINKDINKLKYKHQEIILEDNNAYRLVQTAYTLSDLQVVKPNTENKVIAFSI